MARTGERTPRHEATKRGWFGVPLGDVIAGLSVALVLIPQSLAYAKLAGLPPHYGLYAAALPPIAAALFASSPYLQTGPTALTSILTFGILASVIGLAGERLVLAAVLLALIVGILRILIGILRLGGVIYLMSRPVVMGFTVAAAVLILLSQIPTALGVPAEGESILARFSWAVTHPSLWNAGAVLLSILTIAFMLVGKRLSPLFPGVPIAMGGGLLASYFLGFGGPVVGAIPLEFSLPSLQGLPWELVPNLFIGGSVIAVVGFAEVAAIARTFVVEDRGRWDANQEFISQGVANITSGLFSGFPVGGSFSRSALSRIAGGKTRWCGAITGLVVLAVLPLVALFEMLPQAVLGAIVIGSVLSLMDFRSLFGLWHYTKTQFVIAWSTFALTLLLAPRIDHAVLVGIALSIGALLWRELQLETTVRWKHDGVHLRLTGVLWFGSAHDLENALQKILAQPQRAKKLKVDLTRVGRIDLSGAMVLHRLLEDAERSGIQVETEGLSSRTKELLELLSRRQ